MLERLLTPWGLYGALRDQLGSVRGVYLAGNKIPRRDDFRQQEEIVLLLHGFFQTRNIWEVMEDRLRFDGYGVLSFNLGGLFYRFNTHPVDKVAALVAEKVESLAERHGFAAVHVIGHSKGGIVARRWVQQHGGRSRVKSLITLATPHHGTPTAVAGVIATAVLGGGTSASDLLPNSALVRQLNRDPFPPEIPLTSIWSRSDVVCPYWCSIVRARAGEGDVTNVEVPGLGHSELTWSPAVYRHVRERLAIASKRWMERQPAAVAAR